MILVLHNIRSMHNVGSIFRTADAAGIEKIYLCGITPSPLNEFKKYRPQISKVALGAEKTVPWEKCGPTWRLLDKLKEDSYTIFAIEQHERSIPYNKVRLARSEKKKSALVLGHEIKGLSQGVLKRCDRILEIPMAGEKESLNVSVAFGIVIFSLINN
ncbi:MAG: RNA methyltransferase [Candidatus Spechtbacterales bacterium]|nr:RNA methyltransferase [Candidatus Spechtbacterales bacterium]